MAPTIFKQVIMKFQIFAPLTFPYPFDEIPIAVIRLYDEAIIIYFNENNEFITCVKPRKHTMPAHLWFKARIDYLKSIS